MVILVKREIVFIHRNATFYLSRNVFPQHTGNDHALLQAGRFVDLVLDIFNIQKNFSNDLSYFIIVHQDDNRFTDRLYRCYCDRYMQQFVEFSCMNLNLVY